MRAHIAQLSRFCPLSRISASMTFATSISDNIMRTSSAPDVSLHRFQKESEAVFGVKRESKMSTREQELKESKRLRSAIKMSRTLPAIYSSGKKPFPRFAAWKSNGPKAWKGHLGPLSKSAQVATRHSLRRKSPTLSSALATLRSKARVTLFPQKKNNNARSLKPRYCGQNREGPIPIREVMQVWLTEIKPCLRGAIAGDAGRRSQGVP
jgi:hypothetical protein